MPFQHCCKPAFRLPEGAIADPLSKIVTEPGDFKESPRDLSTQPERPVPTPASTHSTLRPDQLRRLFLFASLDENQLEWLSRHGHKAKQPAGGPVYTQGEPAEYFIVVVDGTVALRSRSHGDDIETVRTSQRGVYAGATRAYLEDIEQTYPNTLQAITDVELFLLPATDFSQAVHNWFPMAVHLLEGLFFAGRLSSVLYDKYERHLALGTFAAGLAHELNNPAAAAAGATGALREIVRDTQRNMIEIPGTPLDSSTLDMLAEAQHEALRQPVTQKRPPAALEVADREEGLRDWLADQGLTDSGHLAAALVCGHFTRDSLDQIVALLPPDRRAAAIRWLACSIDVESLLDDMDHATSRIAELVGAAHERMRRRAVQGTIDIQDLLDSALLIASPIGAVYVRRIYQPVAPVLANHADLIAVFVALIDNALQAMDGEGTLTVACHCDDEYVFADIGDNGPGIPMELQRRIFEPFFTTRPAGKGAGLGLDRAYRTIVEKYHGDIKVTSAPGNTLFRVVLPFPH